MTHEILSYLKSVRTELTKVTWPSRDEASYMTMIVILGSLLVGLYIGGLDFGFTNLLGLILK
jgi:preprotein translocase subunit SecE